MYILDTNVVSELRKAKKADQNAIGNRYAVPWLSGNNGLKNALHRRVGHTTDATFRRYAIVSEDNIVAAGRKIGAKPIAVLNSNRARARQKIQMLIASGRSLNLQLHMFFLLQVGDYLE